VGHVPILMLARNLMLRTRRQVSSHGATI